MKLNKLLSIIVLFILLGTGFAFAGISAITPSLNLDGQSGRFTITGYNISGTNLNWTDLYEFPISCPTGSYVTAINDSITCTAINTESLGSTLDKGITSSFNFNNGSSTTSTIYDGGFTENDISYLGGIYNNTGGFNGQGSISDIADDLNMSHTIKGLNILEGAVCVRFKYRDLTNEDVIMTSLDQGSGTRLKINLYSSGGNRIRGIIGSSPTLESSYNSAVNTWYDVCLAWDNRADLNKVYLYIDGSLDDTEDGNFTSFKDTQFIGSNGALGNFLNGTIDDIRYYNRLPSANELLWVYNTEYESKDAYVLKKDGFTGTCADGTALTVVNGKITGCA